MKKVAVLQSNYIPWKGYFDIINDVDEFIFHDDIQYTKGDWRNRNQIATLYGLKWLTIPCGTNTKRRINEVLLPNHLNWQNQHYQIIYENYRKTPYFNKYKEFLEYVYKETKWTYLSQLNQYIIKEISQNFLGINVKFSNSTEYKTQGVKHEKLLNLLKNVGATVYVSGPAAKDYIIREDYEKARIELIWKDYDGYPEYFRQGQPFYDKVSILDVLFYTGESAPDYIWNWRK